MVNHPNRSKRLALIGRIYTVFVQGKSSVYAVESPELTLGKDMTFTEGYNHLRQQDYAVKVIEVILNEGYVRDCSKEMAEKWLAEFEGDIDDLPLFVTENLSRETIEEHFSEIESWQDQVRYISSPEVMGRV